MKYAGIILVLVVLLSAYGYRHSRSGSDKPSKTANTSVAVTSVKSKKMAPGAACCKVSFSRAKMLSVKNNHTNIAPQGK